MSEAANPLETYWDDDDYGPEPGDDDWCPTCQGSGRVPVSDGYHEYLGYDYEACPDCEHGTEVHCDRGRFF